MKLREKVNDLKSQIKTSKTTFAVYCILRFFVLACLVFAIINRNWENVFYCVLTLVMFLLPAFVEKTFRINLPTAMEIVILLFAFAAEILGEMSSFYIKIPIWDTMLHTTNGFLCAALGFCFVDLLNRNKKIKFELSPFFLALVAFCFSMTIGVLWEFWEFGCDIVLNLDMQKDTIINEIHTVMLDPTASNTAVTISGITEVYVNGQPMGLGGYLDIGLYDTMKDMFVNFIGAVVFSTIGYFYVKNRGKGKIASMFIPTVEFDEEKEEEGCLTE